MTRSTNGQSAWHSVAARSLLIPFAICVLLLLSYTRSEAQIDPDESFPPPVSLASKAEQEKLSSAKNVKERTKFALEMMTSRLASAERYLSQTDFDNLYRELGCFAGVLADQLDYMVRTDNDSGRSLDNFKRFEIGLRGFTPRIENIRRELPQRYEPFVRSVGKTIRDARSRALEPLFSDTVLPEPRRP